MEHTVTIVSLLIALSVASERLVEIIKGLLPCLNERNGDAKREGWRKAALQLLAVGSGILTTWLAYPAVQNALPQGWTKGCVIPLGLLASGGSGLWNAVLAYLLQIKDIATLDAATKRKNLPQVP